MILSVISVAFLAGYGILIFFYYRHWKQLPTYNSNSPASVFVSVIIAARNEENTLPRLLLDLQQQNYSSRLYEVIIVNDFSTDGTASLAQSLPLNFKMIEPDCRPEESSKKRAIAAGVGAAKGELILVTDADCRAGENWLATVASFYEEKAASFVAAPVRFVYEASLLQIFQTLDFITLQGITAASVSAGVHTMCNGANLAYTKHAFEAVNGFAGIDKVPTGDDMLLMHKIWKQNPAKVFYLKSKDVIVSTAALKTWREFFQQRLRWASKTLVYDDWRIKVVLGFVLLLNLLPFILLIAGFYNPVYFIYLLTFLLVKTIIEAPFVFSVATFYGEQRLMKYFFFLQPFHVFYTVFIGAWSQLGSYNWKGRTVRPPQSLKGDLAHAQEPT